MWSTSDSACRFLSTLSRSGDGVGQGSQGRPQAARRGSLDGPVSDRPGATGLQQGKRSLLFMPRPRLPQMGRERAPVTWAVMFTDLVGSTALRVRVGEQAFDNLRIEMDRTTTGTINGGGPDIELRSLNGAVYLRKGK